MNYPLQALMQLGVIPPVTFPTDSRYYGSGTLHVHRARRASIAYLARRIVPQPGAPNYATVAQHTVRQGDRLDLIAAKYLGDPLLFWLICDANGAIRPHDLVADAGHGADHHHAAGRAGRTRVLSSVQLTLMMGPIDPARPCRARCIDALAEVEVTVHDVGHERLPAHLQHRQAVAAADPVPADRRPAAAVHARASSSPRSTASPTC